MVWLLSKRRNALELMYDMLDNMPNRITMLLNKVKMSHIQCKKYLKKLKDANLVVLENGEYKITKRGFQFKKILGELFEEPRVKQDSI